MIDIHSHILPGVDDGAQTIEESIQMAKAAVEEGITTIVATPHHDGQYSNYKHDIIIQVSELNRILREKNIPLEVLPGQEPRISDELIEGLRKEKILTINEDSTFVFIEFPHDDVPHYASRLIFDLQVEGYQPIIVHPERNLKIQENPNVLYSLIKNGAFSQVTAGSVTGDFGRTAKKTAIQLIEANLTHLIASDAHNTKKRGYYMKKAYNELEKEYGQSMVYYFIENAEYVIDGQALASDPPERVKKKKVLGLF
ncbi:tyrosine protein phosphatase [Halobacillus andaensis]|uniref:Tyrosine-protein phosphatase n=1 Tax=Halobacillus andaensis TaxID=1176239 RepID=A0A917EYG1_HALAA|nr:CpsB/CapC family capsule biosynthesis tyrosine phosphatase [Halobacillus andaensis]MBP2004313.1 protein-tyrosine phosphatase [Halobacillus andaensis]GGF22577.1 tyrosine protein phosphatase [Halobacillus andaensis]